MRRKVVLVLLILFLGEHGGIELLILAACRAMPAPETPPTQEESAVSIVTQTPEAASPLPGSGETPIPASETPSPNVPPIAGPTPLPIVDLPLMGVEMINNGSFISKVPIAAQAGVHWVRLNGLFWSDIEPTEGERDWDQLSLFEERIQAASAAGLQMIVIVRSTPAWAQARPGYYCGPVHPGKLATFGKFMHDLVSRYSQPPFNVRYWELGNEPDIDPRHVPPDNIFGCWGDENSPYYGGEYYAEMLKAVYPQVKAADPDTQVLVGGLLLDCDPNNPPELQP
ncbi:MAG: hypothetical protein ACE5GO_05235, partial [Anaerolineales bacterium]